MGLPVVFDNALLNFLEKNLPCMSFGILFYRHRAVLRPAQKNSLENQKSVLWMINYDKLPNFW